ncbi:Peroxisome biogenesis protein 5-like protein, partial [Drosera capensis]
MKKLKWFMLFHRLERYFMFEEFMFQTLQVAFCRSVACYNVVVGLHMTYTPFYSLADQPESWVREFAGGKQETAEDQWVDEFSKLHMQDWADEFGNQLGSAIRDDTSDGWASAYD